MSMKLFTIVTEGRMLAWDPEATFSTWEKMKLLYSDSKGEKDQEMAKQAGPSQSGPSGSGNGESRLGATVEEVAE